jgi:integrase
MISNGEDILWVSKMLCHTTSAMTLNKYARYVENKDKKRGTFLIAS